MDVFLIKDDGFLEKYNTIWDKVSADIKKEFDSEPVYSKELLKNKIKSHGDEVTDFYYKKTPYFFKSNQFGFYSQKDENYYSQVFLKECKYIEKKLVRYINDNLSDFYHSDDSDETKIKAIRLMIF